MSIEPPRALGNCGARRPRGFALFRDLGYTRAVVPDANRNDILLEHSYRTKIEILLARDLSEVLGYALDGNATRIAAIQNELKRKPSRRTK